MTIPRSWHVTKIREKANCRNEPMEVTWIAIIASVCMGIGGVLIFVFAVKRNYFGDLGMRSTRCSGRKWRPWC